ncbi:autotransporter outer membrane beta-barrel domain-containing protein [Megamonas hypermegale]|uniref:autotransporter outer membrane beta-barrel domain-containing protein n=1 Tax=Megamonas hypermegale TaxID=158847 RepID=UPI0026F25538|nr:autotransporter outer membrane beta-barrel domain-containing protein [Megamonas hypermegale]
MKKRRIERAIVLGLILSTSVYGTSFAQDIDDTVTQQSQIVNNGAEITIDGNTNSAIEPDEDIVITTDEGNDITLNSDKYGIHIDDGHNVTLTSGKDNVINITQTANLNDKNGQQDGIKIENGKISNINFTAAEKNIVKATNNGIYVGSDNSSNVTFTAGTNNEFITGNNGIDHRGAGIVTVEATGANIIRAGIKQDTVLDSTKNAGYDINTIDKETAFITDKDGDGVRIQGNGNVTLTAGTYNDIAARDTGLYIHGDSTNSTIELIANGVNENGYGNIIYAEENGIQLDSENEAADTSIIVTANNGRNSIYGKVNGIYNSGSGKITINAKSDGITTYADPIIGDPDNNIVGEQNGIQSDGTGITEVIAENGDNTIAGTKNGILSDGEGTITVTAGNNNTIGQYTDGSGTHTSESGINVSNGTVTVTSGNQNKIYGTKTGITATGENSTVNLDGKINVITVKNPAEDMNAGAEGITANEGATVAIKNNNDDGVSPQQTIINTTAENKYSYGIHADNRGTVTIESDTLQINSINNKITGQDGQSEVAGILAGGGLSDKTGEENSSIKVTAGNGIDINITTNGATGYGVRANKAGNVDLTTTKGNIDIDIKNDEKTDIQKSWDKYGISAEENSNVALKADNGSINITVGDKNQLNGRASYGIYLNGINGGTEATAGVSIHASEDININSYSNYTYNKDTSGIYSAGNAKADITAGGAIHIDTKTADTNGNKVEGIQVTSSNDEIKLKANDEITVNVESNQAFGVSATAGNINIESANGNIEISAVAHNNGLTSARGISIADSNRENGTKIALNTSKNILVSAENAGTSIGVYSKRGLIDLDGDNVQLIANSTGNNNMYSKAYGIYTSDGTADIDSKTNTVILTNVIKDNNGNFIANDNKESLGYGIWAESSSLSDVNSTDSTGIYYTDTGIYSRTNSEVKLQAGTTNEIVAESYGIDAGASTITLTATTDSNIISAGTVEDSGIGAGVGNAVAISALTASTVKLDAGNTNALAGTLYAKDSGTTVTLEADKNNVIQSSQRRTQTENEQEQNFVTALYARDNANVTLTAGDGGSNYIASEAGTLGADELERTVWAHKGADININGTTVIRASNAETNEIWQEGMGNSKGVAVTAGTGVWDPASPPDFNVADADRSIVNINGDATIYGDVASAYEGLVNINTDGTHSTVLEGNALAGNGGKLNINLGEGGQWDGRADDYGDASVMGENGHQSFFAPAFSSEISQGGQVNLTMGNNSTWNVRGQSWITSIDTTNAQNAKIDLVKANPDRNASAHALTVYDLKGDVNFEMSLDADRDVSDMLYIKKADGNYDINVIDSVTTADMYANGLNGLRFATVGAGSNVNFRAFTLDDGALNVEYEVGTDSYENNHENVVYNGESLDSEKPGNDTVDNFFDSTLAPGETPAQEQPVQDENQGTQTQSKAKVKMARLAADNEVATLAEDTAGEENTVATQAEETASTSNVNETTNFKLIARKSETLSDAGKTILNMSRANYNQAVYMDTLNKRMGEARYLEEDQEGLWVRMRHDKTDKDTGFEISTNMYELGYDKKYESKDGNGYHRRGVALDYMDGDTSYDDIAGGGETNRKGIWVYDTWFGNKGHYTDYIVKWGHLENSFDLYTKSRGEKVSGEYNNDVYSISAEWGYKDKLNDNGWYLEPQLQMQYARVTGADYTTTQGTDVSVDGFDSLIARAGFRLGKDFGENNKKKSTFYIKGDVLHEFLGDQDITVMDKTTDGIARSIGYDNDGTWYTVGLGFSTMLSDHSYAFLDVEKVFGNDNDNSYQINGGVQWAL